VTTSFCCVVCGADAWDTEATWRCTACGHVYDVVDGVPKLYVESELGRHDRRLRDRMYRGRFGRWYQFTGPLLTLPARPIRGSGRAWLAYAVLLLVALAALVYAIDLLAVRGLDALTVWDAPALVALALVGLAVVTRPYLAALIVLAIPTKIAIAVTDFVPDEEFQTAHRRLVGELASRGEHLQLLDVATGTCNSLIRHGWLSLDAGFTAVDLSETMLLQGRDAMAGRGVPIQLALADAARLPLESGAFDVVLSYGAVNGMTEPGRALAEMTRVAKPGARVVFFDEQLHASASLVERLYFRFVLSAHNTIHHCPVELMGPELGEVRVNQVYRFYYLCTAVRAITS
jgi:ubiquinone/menaquinone biosynthesis C-methylase UbiE